MFAAQGSAFFAIDGVKVTTMTTFEEAFRDRAGGFILYIGIATQCGLRRYLTGCCGESEMWSTAQASSLTEFIESPSEYEDVGYDCLDQGNDVFGINFFNLSPREMRRFIAQSSEIVCPL